MNQVLNLDLAPIRPLLGTWTDFIGDIFFTETMASIQRDVERAYLRDPKCYPFDKDFFHHFRVAPTSNLKVMRLMRWPMDNQAYLAEQGIMMFPMELSHSQKEDHIFWRKFTDNVIFRLSSSNVLFWVDDLMALKLLEDMHAPNIVPLGEGREYITDWVRTNHSVEINWFK